MAVEQRDVVIQLETDNNWKQEDLMKESKPYNIPKRQECCNELNDKSRMKGDFQVRFREKLGAKFPWLTRLRAWSREAPATRCLPHR